ncbi:hypothetical protein PsorP6_015908 [Peronosclerospora sorghi]|uniref:Uncharacterized protein n=1 Tax=Peronosclerospora sorghi TaxID=230839 RepID=A0ACC0WQ14_9STRA|nr:hypothetical protein PsorP6_015908 [Peronosclerospora sorghi]
MPALLLLLWLATAAARVCADTAVRPNGHPADTLSPAEAKLTPGLFRGTEEAPDERDQERAHPGVETASASWLSTWLPLPARNMLKSLVSSKSKAWEAIKNKVMPILETLHVVESTDERNKRIVKQLVKRYGVRNVARALVYPRPTPSLEATATAMFGVLHKMCLRRLWKRRRNANILFVSCMDVVEDFLKSWNTKYKQQKTLFEFLEPFVSESVLAESIGLAKVDSSHTERALALQNSLVEKWKLEDVHPRLLLGRLGLDQRVYDVKNPSMETMRVYLREYNAIHRNGQFSLLAWLTQKYKVSTLVEELVWAVTFPSTHRVSKELQYELLQTWLRNGLSVDDAFKLLELDQQGTFVQHSPALALLEGYTNMYNRIKPVKDRQDLLQVVANGLDDGRLALFLAIKSEWLSIPEENYSKSLSRLFERWHKAGIEPKNVESTFFSNAYPYLISKIDDIVSKYEEAYPELERRTTG